MFLQQRHAAEGARADATLVLLHLGVCLQVSPQVGAIGEGPVAVGAGERALTCVCADVSTQQPRPGESLSTGGADAGQSV